MLPFVVVDDSSGEDRETQLLPYAVNNSKKKNMTTVAYMSPLQRDQHPSREMRQHNVI